MALNQYLINSFVSFTGGALMYTTYYVQDRLDKKEPIDNKEVLNIALNNGLYAYSLQNLLYVFFRIKNFK